MSLSLGPRRLSLVSRRKSAFIGVHRRFRSRDSCPRASFVVVIVGGIGVGKPHSSLIHPFPSIPGAGAGFRRDFTGARGRDTSRECHGRSRQSTRPVRLRGTGHWSRITGRSHPAAIPGRSGVLGTSGGAATYALLYNKRPTRGGSWELGLIMGLGGVLSGLRRDVSRGGRCRAGRFPAGGFHAGGFETRPYCCPGADLPIEWAWL
jgi:hypothetical protein